MSRDTGDLATDLQECAFSSTRCFARLCIVLWHGNTRCDSFKQAEAADNGVPWHVRTHSRTRVHSSTQNYTPPRSGKHAGVINGNLAECLLGLARSLASCGQSTCPANFKNHIITQGCSNVTARVNTSAATIGTTTCLSMSGIAVAWQAGTQRYASESTACDASAGAKGGLPGPYLACAAANRHLAGLLSIINCHPPAWQHEACFPLLTCRAASSRCTG